MKTNTAIGIGVVMILAIGLITVVGYESTKSSPQSSTQSGVVANSSSQVLSHSSSGSASAVQSSAASSSSSSSGPGSTASPGDFAVMATDPPIVASGVTAATATYDSLAIHSSGSSNSSGWTQLNGSGTIDLTSSANVSQTLAAAKVEAGTYDMVRMGIQSVSVTYQGKVYEAAVASSNITSHLQSTAQVNSSQSTEALVDLRTFVINAANSSQPQFIFSATAESTTVPPSSTTSASMQVGARTTLHGSWWVGFNDQTSTNVTISSATLTGSSLTLQLGNQGNGTARIQAVTITPVSAVGSLSAETLPSTFAGSAVLTVNQSGQLQETDSLGVAALVDGNGTACAAGSSTSLSYSGTISLGIGVAGIQLSGVVPGQEYLVTVIGANTYGSAVVTAQ